MPFAVSTSIFRSSITICFVLYHFVDLTDLPPQVNSLSFHLAQESPVTSILQEGLRRIPAAWHFYYRLGAAYMGLGQYEKAEDGFLKARSMAATALPDINVKLANVYLKEGAFDKAYAEMAQYLQANLEGRFASKTREVMSRPETSGLLTAAQGRTVPHQPEKP